VLLGSRDAKVRNILKPDIFPTEPNTLGDEGVATSNPNTPDNPEELDTWQDLGNRLPIKHDFKVQSHPRAQRCTRYHTYDSYTTSLPHHDPKAFQARYKDRKPWAPYVKRLDFKLSEWMHHTGLNHKQIDALLLIVHQIRSMPKEVTLVDLQHVLEM
jgi:hypothetical protein